MEAGNATISGGFSYVLVPGADFKEGMVGLLMLIGGDRYGKIFRDIVSYRCVNSGFI